MGHSRIAAASRLWMKPCHAFHITTKDELLPIDEAVALVERVRDSADRHAALALDALSMAVPGIAGIALRVCPSLPATIAERIRDYRARNVADWVMYRNALASAAEVRGWPIYWYDAKKVVDSASQLLNENFDAHFLQMRRTLGPPWNQDHKLAMAAAIVSASPVRLAAFEFGP